MTVRRPSSGRRVGAGRVRVDAARAIAKLRDYQLPNRIAWILEAVRAAVASDATHIELTGDANDVWLAWSGEPWPVAVLPRLLDELVSPEPAREGQRLRLLATAINSALGMNPSYVDVYALEAGGPALRARYTPDVLELPADDEDAAPLDRVQVQQVAAPEQARAPGMLVHLRRRAGLETLGYFLRREPPEFALAAQACGDVPVPFVLDGVTLGRDAPGRDLLREPLGRDLDGFVALTSAVDDPTTVDSPLMAMAERGAVVVRYPFDLVEGMVWRKVPLRVFVDAPRMPTNASRSDVRRDAHPVPDAQQAAVTALSSLCARVAEALSTESPDPRLRTAALALLGSAVAGPDWARWLQSLPPAYESLANVALVRNALGEPRPVRSHWNERVVHLGDEPYPMEYAPWFADVLWAEPDDKATRMLVGPGLDDEPAKSLARQAKRHLRAQRRFRKHAERAPRLERPRRFWILASAQARMPLSCTDDDGDAPYEGEVCLVRGARGGKITLLLEGREIEDVYVQSNIAFRAILHSPDLTPSDGYRTVERDHRYAQAEAAVMRAVVVAAEALAEAFTSGVVREGFELGSEFAQQHEATAELIRRASRYAAVRYCVTDPTPLGRAPVWRTLDGRAVGLADLAQAPVVGTVATGTKAPQAADRLLVACDAAERTMLRNVLEPQTAVVHYDLAWLLRADGNAAARMAEAFVASYDVAALSITEDRVRGAIAWGVPDSTLRIHHAGVALATHGYAHALAPCALAVDADDAIPTASWTDLRHDAGVSERDFSDWEAQLARAVAATLAGDVVPELVTRTGGVLPDSPAARALYAALAAAPNASELLGSTLVARLRTQPLIPCLGVGRIDAERLLASFDDVIPYLNALPNAALPGWPAVIGEDYAYLAAALTGRNIFNASHELAGRFAHVEYERNLAMHRERAVQPLALAPPCVAVQHDDIRGFVGPGSRPGLTLSIYLEERPFDSSVRPCAVPLAAVFDIPAHRVGPRCLTVLDTTYDQLERLAIDAVPALLAKLAETSPRALTEHHALRIVWLAWLEAEGETDETRARMATLPAFRTIQGGDASVDDARYEGSIRVARYFDAWLPANGEEGWLDRPILQLPDSEVGTQLERIIQHLSADPILDVTKPARRLQQTRRIGQGLLPLPTLRGVEPAFTRNLRDLDDSLGAGQIALVPKAPSQLIVFAEGAWCANVPVATWPPAHMAIEAPVLASHAASGHALPERLLPYVREMQRATWQLVDAVMNQSDANALPDWLRDSVVHALLSAACDGEEPRGAAHAPVFDTTAGTRVSWSELQAQAAHHGDVWYTDQDSSALPLDPARFALRLSPAATPATFTAAFAVVDATYELALDAEARANRAVAPATSLELTPAEQTQVLGVTTLDGDGTSEPRGVVAPLWPAAAHLRTARMHRTMQPIGVMVDPCEWPTIAVVDDARLAPNRVWSGPEDDEAMASVVGAMRRASEAALVQAVQEPKTALTSRALTGRIKAVQAVAADHRVIVRGRMWLDGPPRPGVIRIGNDDVRIPMPVDGLLLVHAPISRLPMPSGRLPAPGQLPALAPHMLASDVYPLLLRQLLRRKHADPDLVAAHLAHALAHSIIEPDDAGDVQFDCFTAGPRSATQLASLLRGEAPVSTADLVYDDSALSRTVRTLLAARLQTMAAPYVGGAIREATEVIDDVIELSDLDLEEVPATPSHPLDALARALHQRLVHVGLGPVVAGVQIVPGRKRPLVQVRSAVVQLAGDHPRLRTSALHGATAPITLLAAHIATLLNVALTEITDAKEADALVRLLGPPATDRSAPGSG